MWEQFDNGASIGSKGSEDGIIVLDEEHINCARVTLERDGCTAPWTITCGIYGFFFHTAFASSETEGRMKYEHMREDLVKIMQEKDEACQNQKVHDFVNKY